MRIAILRCGLNVGGAERVCIQLAEGLQEKGVEVVILLTEGPVKMDVKNVSVVQILHAGTPNLLQKFLRLPVQYWRVLRYIRKNKIEVVISMEERANILNLALPGKQKRILTVHTYLSRSLNERTFAQRLPTKAFLGLFLWRADLVVCVSRGSAKDFQSLFPVKPDRLTTMYNSFDIDEVIALSRETLEAQYRELFEAKVVIAVGHLNKAKGHWHLIRAFKRIQQSVPEARLVFLGDGPLREYLETLTTDLGLRDKVHFLGFHANPFKFVSRSTVFAFTSLWEGFGCALVEALICNTATVSTDCRFGPREILAPDTNLCRVTDEIEQAKYGTLIPPLDERFKDANASLTRGETLLAEAITTLIQNESLRTRYEQLGAQRALAFRRQSVMNKWVEMLGKL